MTKDPRDTATDESTFWSDFEYELAMPRPQRPAISEADVQAERDAHLAFRATLIGDGINCEGARLRVLNLGETVFLGRAQGAGWSHEYRTGVTPQGHLVVVEFVGNNVLAYGGQPVMDELAAIDRNDLSIKARPSASRAPTAVEFGDDDRL